MSNHRWLSLAVVVQFFFFVVAAAPHMVHHGLRDGDSQGCPVSAIATQTTGDLPDIHPLPTPLLLTDVLQTFDLILSESFAPQVYRSRAPPLRLPA